MQRQVLMTNMLCCVKLSVELAGNRPAVYKHLKGRPYAIARSAFIPSALLFPHESIIFFAASELMQ